MELVYGMIENVRQIWTHYLPGTRDQVKVAYRRREEHNILHVFINFAHSDLHLGSARAVLVKNANQIGMFCEHLKATLSSIDDDQAMGILAFGDAERGELQHTMVISTLGTLGLSDYHMRNGFMALNSNRIHDTRLTHLSAVDACR